MVVGLVFEVIFRSRWVLLASSLLAWVATRVALDNPLFMPPSIARLRPVLINNFWIHIHVPTMMLSYATLGRRGADGARLAHHAALPEGDAPRDARPWRSSSTGSSRPA